MKINKIAGLLLYAGILFVYSSAVECMNGRTPLQVITGQPNGGVLDHCVGLGGFPNHENPNVINMAFVTSPRRTIAYSPIASVATAALIGGLAVHYDVPNKILALMPEPVREGISNMSPNTAEKLTVAACALLYAYVCKLFYYLITQRPTKMICTGGFIAIPATVCARILAIPVELYELNVEPGKAIRFLSSWSVTLKTCFAQTQKYVPRKKCIKTTYPIRFFNADKQMCQKEALQVLGLDQSRKTITILGGSQGSLEINNIIHEFISTHPEMHHMIQIIHQIGQKDTFNWQAFYAQHAIPAHVFSFCSDLAPHYAAADLIICRSGAGTLFEVLFFGKPCITIPLITKTNNHQLKNALAMQEEYGELFTAFAPLQEDKSRITKDIFSKIGYILTLVASPDRTATNANNI